MPYEYRKLTPDQRKYVVEQRRFLGFPLHAPPHPFRSAGHYLLTAVNFEHARIMVSPVRRSEFQSRLLNAFYEINADIVGWVILENHYHILVGVDSLDDVSAAIKQLHGATSFEWNQQDGQRGKRKVWYRFYDSAIRNNSHYYCALNYIHFNPAKHGYVTNPYDWQWSSLSMYFEDLGREWLREKWREFQPEKDFGSGWDDESDE